MIHVVALLVAGAGGREALRAFETRAIPILREHGGVLRAAFSPEPLAGGPRPDEVHLLEFPSVEAFAAYRSDARLAALAELRADAIASSTVYVSAELLDY